MSNKIIVVLYAKKRAVKYLTFITKQNTVLNCISRQKNYDIFNVNIIILKGVIR